jgi:hypothetical protein
LESPLPWWERARVRGNKTFPFHPHQLPPTFFPPPQGGRSKRRGHPPPSRGRKILEIFIIKNYYPFPAIWERPDENLLELYKIGAVLARKKFRR